MTLSTFKKLLPETDAAAEDGGPPWAPLGSRRASGGSASSPTADGGRTFLHGQQRVLFSPGYFLRGLVLLILSAAHAVSAITIGQGPALANSLGSTTDKRGTTWYEEFQDWSAADLRALDVNADMLSISDGHDSARDIVALYSHEDAGNFYFRVDVFDLLFGSENGNLDIYLAIDCAPGGETAFPDGIDTLVDAAYPWDICIALYDAVNFNVYNSLSSTVNAHWLGSYWRSDLDGVEFGIAKQALLDAGWNGTDVLYLQVVTGKDFHDQPGESDAFDTVGTLNRNVGGGNGQVVGAVASDASTSRAKYALIAHANQSLNSKSGTQGHIYTDRSDIDLYPGFIRLLDSAEMLNIPINLHISGTLLMSFLWATQDPTEPGYPDRDGPTFLSRCSNFVTNGPGSLIGGVLAEHIMPYYEGEVNAKSIAQNSALLEHLFGLTEEDMKVMHVPERVIRSNTNSVHVSADGPLDGKTFEEIENSDYIATYIDEVTHLHWWFYPDEQNNPGWDDFNCGRWAGGQGNDEEPYHHKVHKINGVYCFMINDREDQSKFGPYDGGMHRDTRYTLLDKAMNPDSSQVTLVFDDWEALAGNSFASGAPNNNADQIHATLRWAANHPWIEMVNLRDVITWATNDASWVIDHGYVYDKPSQTYEWLKRASEHSYDGWYYGNTQESNFFARTPPVYWEGGDVVPAGMKMYGDLNTPNTLMHDSWETVQQITATNLKDLAEWAYSAMIYETAWHVEDADPDHYKSRNYQDIAQGGFNRGTAQGNCDDSYEDSTPDRVVDWALRLQGHVRDGGVMRDASEWVEDIKSGAQGPETFVYAKDIDDDTLDEYVLCNNRVYLCFERWGARLIKAFVYDADLNGGDAREVVGAPASNPAEEHENEGPNQNRCSAFKDRYNFGMGDNRYVDMDFANTAPVPGVNGWTFTSKDGLIRKTISLWDGRDVALATYELDPAVGNLETRFGLGPNQMDLMFNGPANLQALSDPTYRGLRNTQGGAAFVVLGAQSSFNANPSQTGWGHRELPLVEQFETVSSGTNFSMALVFSPGSANDLDGDGLANTNEMALGTDYAKWDSDEDGIADGWEVANGLNPNADDAGANSDTDEFNNWEEYVADTHPTNGNAFLWAQQVTHSSPIRVHFEASTNRVYSLLYTEALDGGHWAEVPGQSRVRFSTPGLQWLTDNVDTNTRAYRIQVELP